MKVFVKWSISIEERILKYMLELVRELRMKITRCKYGHYYDKAYFRECPHCCRKRGGRDEDIIINNIEQSVVLSGKSQGEIQAEANSQKEKDRENVKRWIGEAWDELEEILSEDTELDGNREELTQKEYSINGREVENRRSSDSQKGVSKAGILNKISKREAGNVNKKEGIEDRLSEQECEKESARAEIKKEAKEESQVRKEEKREVRKEKTDEKLQENYMIFAAMPLKVIKNQEFCMDFCLLSEEDWETGAKMLAFKSQESIRDLKPVKMSSPANAVLHILYKDEEILSKKIVIERNQEKVFYTFPVTVTDTRDRRFHMIKVIFEIEEQGIEVPLYLMPNP